MMIWKSSINQLRSVQKFIFISTEFSVKSYFMKIQALCLVLSALILMGAAGRDITGDERASLEEQTSALRKKILVLEHEQDFLLFQKAMYNTDSKYLIMDFTSRKGQLRYKNRVLMDFRFKMSGKYSSQRPQPGMVVLTKKKERKNGLNTLAFGKSFIMQGKRTAVSAEESGISAISLQKKDLLSVYYAVEEGALAYVIR